MKMAGGDIWANFGVESMVCVYHCYSLIWNAVIEEIYYKLELNNTEDRFAVSVCQCETTVGHVPRRISSICSSVLWKKGQLLSELQLQDNILLTFHRGSGDSLPTLF